MKMGKKVAYSDVGTGVLTVFHLSDEDAKKVNQLFQEEEQDSAWELAEKKATKIQTIKDVSGFWDSF